MRVFETILEVSAEGRAVLPLPEGIKPGSYRAVVVLEEVAEPASEPKPAKPAPLPLPEVPVTSWSGSGSTRREDFYGERGR